MKRYCAGLSNHDHQEVKHCSYCQEFKKLSVDHAESLLSRVNRPRLVFAMFDDLSAGHRHQVDY
jgi:hypothetical protein